jgi:hypothetical protein
VPSNPPGVAPWHPLAVEVTGDEVRVFCDGLLVGRQSRADMQRHGTFLFADIPGNDWRFMPLGGVGLYLRDATASFRRIVLRRLP